MSMFEVAGAAMGVAGFFMAVMAYWEVQRTRGDLNMDAGSEARPHARMRSLEKQAFDAARTVRGVSDRADRTAARVDVQSEKTRLLEGHRAAQQEDARVVGKRLNELEGRIKALEERLNRGFVVQPKPEPLSPWPIPNPTITWMGENR